MRGKAVNAYYKIPIVFRLQDTTGRVGLDRDSGEKLSKQPSFPGGMDALAAYLEDAVHYPLVAVEEDIQGTVMTSFTVNADGHISEVNTLNQLNGGCTEEAIRVIEAMPRWIPAENEQGEKVTTQYCIPITFQLKYKNGDFEVTPMSQLGKSPEFPGREKALDAFVKKYLVYPHFAIKAKIQGTVLLECVIDTAGTISVVKTLMSPDPILTKEAIRVINLMPQWIPAEDLQGKKVSVPVRIPVTFRLKN